jgi:hypothetical protein
MVVRPQRGNAHQNNGGKDGRHNCQVQSHRGTELYGHDATCGAGKHPEAVSAVHPRQHPATGLLLADDGERVHGDIKDAARRAEHHEHRGQLPDTADHADQGQRRTEDQRTDDTDPRRLHAVKDPTGQ